DRQLDSYGASIAGAIERGELVYFAAYAGYRRMHATLQVATLPTVAQRQGNLGIPVVNPITGATYANGIIPQSDITPFARKVLGDLPDLNQAGSNNFQSLPRRKDYNDKGDIKIDDTI